MSDKLKDEIRKTLGAIKQAESEHGEKINALKSKLNVLRSVCEHDYEKEFNGVETVSQCKICGSL